jgi:hypothetical protein
MTDFDQICSTPYQLIDKEQANLTHVLYSVVLEIA